MDIVSYLMGKAAGGGGRGGGAFLSWDLKSATPLVDTVRGLPAANTNITYGDDGAIFNSASDYFIFPTLIKCVTIEVDVVSMSLTSGTERRFINSGASGNGFDYRSTGVWSFYAGSSSGWEDTEITDGNYFSGSTVKVYVDENGIWHIYKDSTLIFTSQNALTFTTRTFAGGNQTGFQLGSSEKSINNAVISAVRVY